MFTWHRLGGLLAGLVAFLLLSASAAASPWGVDALDGLLSDALAVCTVSWDGGAGTTSWLDAANWSGDRLPGANDDVCIAAATPGAEVVHGAAAVTQVRSIQAAKPVVVSAGQLGVTAASTLDVLKLTGGTADLDGSTGVGELQQAAGNLDGDGVVTLNGFQRTSTWSGGTQLGLGGTVLADGALQITGAAAKSLEGGRILELKGGTDATWTGGNLALGSGCKLLIDNGSDLHVQPGAGKLARVPGGGGLVGSVQNSGAYIVSTSHIVEVPLNGSGTLAMSTSSSVELRAGGRQTGGVDFAAGSELKISDGSYVLDGAVFSSGGGKNGKLTVQGTGQVALDGPVGFSYLVKEVSIAAGTLTLDADAEIPRFGQTGGQLAGTGNLAVTEFFSFSGGTQSGGVTLVHAAAGGGIGGGGTTVLSGRTLRIAAGVHGFAWTAGNLELRAGATIHNGGELTFDSHGGEIQAGPGGGTVVNEQGGTISVLAAAQLDVPLNAAHGSTIEIKAGDEAALALTGGVAHGRIVVGEGSFVELLGYSLASDSELTGPAGATLGVRSDVVDAAGAVDIGLADVTGGAQVTFHGASTRLGTLNVSAGTARIAANASVGWVTNDGGEISVAANSTLKLDGELGAGTYLQTRGSTSLEAPSSRIEARGAEGGVDLFGGTLVGAGVIAGHLFNAGKIGPGNGIGTLTVDGDYFQHTDGVLALEAGAARSDGLAVTGAAALDGTLTLAAPAGFQPPRDGLQLITTRSLTGRFAKVEAVPGVELEYRPGGVLLLPAAACDKPHARLGSPRPAFLDALNLSRSPSRSLFPRIARVPDGMGVVWLEESRGITFRRIGDDGSPSSPLTLDSGAGEFWRWDVASSGRFVYVVWEQRALDGSPEGFASEVWLAASRDGGDTFAPAVQLSRTPRETSWFPKVAASGDHVSVAWAEYGGTLVHVQSNDAGATFPDAMRHEVTRDALPYGYDVAQSGAVPYVAWRGYFRRREGGIETKGPVLVASSSDGGRTLVPRSVDQTGPESGDPLLAADGELVYVVFGQGPSQLRAAVSRSGSAWSVSTLAEAWDGASVAAADGAAVVAWSSGEETFARTSADGGAFEDAVEVAPGDVEDVAISEGRVHVSTMDHQAGGTHQIVLASSADGGATYERTGGTAFALPRLACGNTGEVLPRVAAFGDTFGVTWNDVQFTDAPPFYGDFEVGYRSGFIADPDLWLRDAHAVQAADDAEKLVAGKPTVIAAEIKSTIPVPRPAAIRLHIRYEGVDQTMTESVVLKPGTQRVFLPLSSDIEPQGHELEYDVKVDPADEIPEADEDNNELPPRTQPVKATKPFRVLVAPIHVAGEPPVACADVQAVRDGAARYLGATFPLAPSEIRVDRRCAAFEIDNERYDDDGLRDVFRLLETAASSARYDKAIGVVRTGWFGDHTVSHLKAVAVAPFDSKYDAVLAERQNTGGWAVAHELSHNLGWVAAGTPGATGDHQNNVPAPGYWVADRLALDRIDWMHADTAGASVASPTGRWIATNTWDYLLGKLAVDPADPSVIAITGVVRNDGSVVADPWYAVDGTVDAPLGSTGELGVRFLDSNGDTIATAGFDATHELTELGGGESAAQLDSLPFAASVPAVDGTAAVQITRGGDVIFQRDRSAHAPSVAVTQPPAGAAFLPGDRVDVTWTSTDGDGDALTHLVQLTTDGGQTWTPLGEDITGSAFTFTVPTTAALSTARLRVIATDGLNTTEALSPEFTIGEPPKIAFTRFEQAQCRHQLYTIDTDGGDLHKLSTCRQVDGTQIEDSDASWSPDGRRIAFERLGEIDSGACCDKRIYVMNSDGADAHLVVDTPEAQDESPDWSPRGDEIVFESNAPLAAGGGLNVVRSDGSGRRQLGLFGFKPSWSPDAARIAYVFNSTLRIVNADGSGDHAVPGPFVDSASAPSWSPDGTRIAFVGESDGAVHVMNAEGGDEHTLPERGFDPAWSPAGDLLAFSCRCPQRDFKLFTMAPDGSGLTPLTDTSNLEELEPDWQPSAGEPAPLAVDAGGPYETDEGQQVDLEAVASGPGSGRAAHDWDLDGDGEYDDGGGTTAASTFADDGTFAAGVRVRTDSNETAADTASIVVRNVPPRIVTATATIDEARDGVLDASVTDPGAADVLAATVDWGDGTAADDVPLIRERDAYAVEATHRYAGPGSFSAKLTVADDDGGVAARTLPLVAAPANRGPVAAPQQVDTHAGVPVALELAALDPDGDSLRLRVVGPPSHGQLLALPRVGPIPLPGVANFVYTPDAGYVGPDRFTYVANDGRVDSAAAEVTVTVQGELPPMPTPGPGPGPGPTPPSEGPAVAAAQLLLACAGRDVALLDVLPAGRRRVVVSGVARIVLAGRKVTILLDGRRVGRTTVGSDGRFRVVVKAPPRSRRARARYQARIGRAASKELRLARRMVATSLRRRGTLLVLRGRITPPFARRAAPIVLERFRTCTDRERVAIGRVVPNRRGRFVIRFPLPPDRGPTLYRARTKVAVHRGRPATKSTFTLPQPVDL